MASRTPEASSAATTSATSWVSTQRTTSTMVRPLAAAANGSGPTSSRPRPSGSQRRPGAAGQSRRLCRVEAPDNAATPPPSIGVANQVGLHADRQDRAPPSQDRRNREAARLPALGGTDDGNGLGRLGCQQLPPRTARRARDPAEDQAAWRRFRTPSDP